VDDPVGVEPPTEPEQPAARTVSAAEHTSQNWHDRYARYAGFGASVRDFHRHRLFRRVTPPEQSQKIRTRGPAITLISL